MFLVVILRCNSMEMNYLSTVWLQISVGGQLFKRVGGEDFFIFLPTMYFGILSQIFHMGSLFALDCQPCNTINDSHSEGNLSEDCHEIELNLTSFNHTEKYKTPAVSIMYGTSNIDETH